MSGTLERTDRLPRTGRRRTRARVLGTVQGVGFRPYAFRLATELELGGWILNDERGVLLEVEGPPEAVDGFLARLPAEAPPLATVEAIDAEPVSPASVASGSSNPIGAGSPRRSSRPTWPRAASASPSCATRPTVGTAIRSPIAPTAGRG